jgi:hypothetical protein
MSFCTFIAIKEQIQAKLTFIMVSGGSHVNYGKELILTDILTRLGKAVDGVIG